MAWVARYPWGIQSVSGENLPPVWMYNQEFARTSGWQWEDPIGTPNAATAPGPAPQPPPGFVWTPDSPPAGGGTPGGGLPADNATARAKASQMLYGAMQGLPNMSPEFMSGLQGGQLPAPGAVTPQTLASLEKDEFLSDQFFALIRASGLYPTSFVSEIGRFQPTGMATPPSFI